MTECYQNDNLTLIFKWIEFDYLPIYLFIYNNVLQIIPTTEQG